MILVSIGSGRSFFRDGCSAFDLRRSGRQKSVQLFRQRGGSDDFRERERVRGGLFLRDSRKALPSILPFVRDGAMLPLMRRRFSLGAGLGRE